MRFQVEAVAHELRNPGWFRGWLAMRSARSNRAPGGARVKPPMTPWMAFVHVRSLHMPFKLADCATLTRSSACQSCGCAVPYGMWEPP